MNEAAILDAAVIKDLSNHIYEKRKATAFQIEGLTKLALARNDSQTIYKIIAELTELTNGGSSLAKMGSITALGSVSVALGSFAIAYFLEEIIKPIFATFKDTDARVRYYACESLYNIAKIARGEILLFFNEVFDILCILVTDTESSVKNAADILDRLIKDIVSAKSTNYVSILHHEDEAQAAIASHTVDANGDAVQVNKVQDSQKAFSLPKFIPTLLERMYTIDPFAKKFLISWLELLDDIPSLELITFLPNFLEPLVNFLMNHSPSDVRIETQNLLSLFLKEIKAINKVRVEVNRQQVNSERKKQRLAIKKNEEAEKAPKEETADLGDSKIENLTTEVKDITIPDEEENDEASIKSDDTTVVRRTTEDEVAESEPPRPTEEGEEFLNGQDIFIDYPRIIDILLSYLRIPNQPTDQKINDLTGESHEIYLEIQICVLKWLQEIILISPTSFSKFLPDCVVLTMKNISITDNNRDIDLRNQFLKFNMALQDFLNNLHKSGIENSTTVENIAGETTEKNEDENLASDEEDEVDENFLLGLTKEVYEDFLDFYLAKTLDSIMTECLTSANELARITLLDWLIFLYSKNPSAFYKPETEDGEKGTGGNTFDLTALLRASIDASNDVILKVLQLLSEISETNQDFFKDFMIKLVKFLESEGMDEKSSQRTGSQIQSLSRNKIEFIIRRLCVSLSSEKIYKTLSEVLISYEGRNLDFLNVMVVTLNNILLTTQELTTFRKKLKNLDGYKYEDWALFASLFQSWCHNSPSALSLCLLTSNYELAYLIIKNLAELEVTFQLLTQLDVLVQLLESPIFLKLRLQLLEPEKHPYLQKTLYGILMVLPQSSTFTTLKNRLSSLSAANNTVAGPAPVMSAISTPVSTPGPSSAAANTSSVSNQLSIKRKRIYEMLDKFTRIQERHEDFHLERSLDSLHSERRGEGQTRQDRLLSHTSTHLEKTDYFSGEKTKRGLSGRFGASRNGSS